MSTLTLDLIRDNFAKDMSEPRQVLLIRILVVVFIAISAVLALVQYIPRTVHVFALLKKCFYSILLGMFYIR